MARLLEEYVPPVGDERGAITGFPIRVQREENQVMYELRDLTNDSTPSIRTGVGDPNGIVPADSGSLFLDQTGELWVNVDGATGWVTTGGGAQGPQGAQGDPGAQGSQGTQGTQGTQGVQGSQGPQGNDGAQGAQGSQGTQGDTGAQGTQGTQGSQGTQGTQGDTGAQGTQGFQGPPGGNSYVYLFNTSTSTPPASGEIRYDNATPASVTHVYVNETDSYSVDISASLATLVYGSQIKVFSEDISSFDNFALFTVTANTDSGAYRDLTVTYVSGNGSFTNGESIVISLLTGGGDVDGPGSSTDNAVARFDGTTGKVIQNSVVIVDDSGNTSGIPTLDVTTLARVGNAGGTVAPLYGSAEFQGVNASSNSIAELNAYGVSNSSVFLGRSSSGTPASPTQTLNGDYMAQFLGAGRTDVAYGGASGGMNVIAIEDWTATARGTCLSFWTTPIGSTSLSTPMILYDDKVFVGVQFQGYEGTAAIPEYSFYADPDTGMYQSSANTLAFSLGGTKYISFSTSFLQSSIPIFSMEVDGAFILFQTNQHNASPNTTWRSRTTRGTAAAPTASQNGDTLLSIAGSGYGTTGDSGDKAKIFVQATENWSDTAQGTRMFFQTTANTTTTTSTALLIENNGQLQALAGSASAPEFTFITDSNTGMYSVGADSLGLTTGGTLRITLSTTSLTSTLPFYGPSGAAATPTFTFSGDTNTGMYSSGADAIGWSTNGASRVTLDNNALNLSVQLRTGNGTNGAPTHSFNNDNDCGMYRVTTNTIGFSANAVLAFQIADSTVASAAGATLDRLSAVAQTITISGSTNITTATGFNLFNIGRPTYSAASALTITDAATLYIANSPLGGGAGPATITNAYSLWIDAGNARFDGVIFASAGTISDVAYSTLGDPNTGIDFPAADAMRLISGGTVGLAVNPAAVTSAASATLNRLSTTAQTIVITGSTNITTATGFNFVNISQPTYSAASALTVDYAASLYISNAPVGGGAGPATLTNVYALWIDSGIARLDGQIQSGDGSAGSPAHSFQSDTNTGMYSVGADDLGFSVGGTLRVDIQTTKVVSTLQIDISSIAAGSPNFIITKTSDTPSTTWTAGVPSNDPSGFIEITEGGGSKYIPFWV